MSTSSPIVSCIVPVFNGALYLAEALDSIFAQTHDRLQVIVVDDGSTDGTPDVIAAYGARVIARRQANCGPAAARNLGATLATGDYIAFLDADDVWAAGKLRRQLEFLDAQPDLDGCVTMIRNFWIPELAAEQARFSDHAIARPMPGFVTQTLLVRRSAFERVGPLNDQAGAGDAADWFIRARDCGVSCELLPETLVHRRLHRSNRSRSLGDRPKKVVLQFLKDSLDRKRAQAQAATGAGAPPAQRKEGDR